MKNICKPRTIQINMDLEINTVQKLPIQNYPHLTNEMKIEISMQYRNWEIVEAPYICHSAHGL